MQSSWQTCRGALGDGSILVSDAAANDLLRVFPNGRSVTVARLKPRVVAVPDELPDQTPEGDPLPPAGTMLPSEAVATSVTVGADGHSYVGEFRGFPATPGKSQIWRIAPDSVNATCDPLAPDTGACRRYADGFTSIVDLAAAPDGSIYVVELVKRSWLQWQFGLANAPVGSLFRILPGGGSRLELAEGAHPARRRRRRQRRHGVRIDSRVRPGKDSARRMSIGRRGP